MPLYDPQQLLTAVMTQFYSLSVSDIQIRSDRLIYVHTKRGLESVDSAGPISIETAEALAEWLYSRRVIDRYQDEETSQKTAGSLLPILREHRVIDFSTEGLPLEEGHVSGRMRVQAHLSSSGLGITCRVLNEGIAELDKLGLSQDTCLALREFVTRRQGLGLVTGQTGSGKSTTLAALINWLRENQERHIVTVEDPIEYHYPQDMGHPDEPNIRIAAPGFVTQQEVGIHVMSYQQGLKDVLRKAPHVILIGEIRDRETMDTCIEAAQTGHVVISTLHTNGAVKTLSRITEFFPKERHKSILARMSEILMFILSQGLISGRDGKALNYEFLKNTNAAVRSGIAHYDGEARSLDDVIRQSGNVEWDTHLQGLLQRGLISQEAYHNNRMNSDEEERIFFGEEAVGF